MTPEKILQGNLFANCSKKGRMEAKVKELQETAIFEMLAKEDAGLAEMLKEFKKLG